MRVVIIVMFPHPLSQSILIYTEHHYNQTSVNMLTLLIKSQKCELKRKYAYLSRKEWIRRHGLFDKKRRGQRYLLKRRLQIALDHIDAIVAILGFSKWSYRQRPLCENEYGLSDKTAQAVLDMPYGSFNGIET